MSSWHFNRLSYICFKRYYFKRYRILKLKYLIFKGIVSKTKEKELNNEGGSIIIKVTCC
jgi:hypothetical protein